MAFNTSDDDSQQRFALGFVFALVLLIVSTVVGSVVYRSVAQGRGTVSSNAPAPMDAAVANQGVPPALAAGAVEEGEGAYIRVDQGVVKFYFATGSAELAAGADDALADVVRIANQRDKKLAVAGFHDGTGDAALNAELAKRRAIAVRDAIVTLGVNMANIELRKPEQTQADGSNAEARRVEVSVIE
ncbi:MAG: OmpA family protein [Acidovorax sp.]|jgi:outer membrane protein OmpA-like peptidoglycan-associated protein|nr:OmpA family protein [Acidovorax sp.]